MIIEVGKFYKTRGGSKVRIYVTDGGIKYPIHGAILKEDDWHAEGWSSDGYYRIDNVGGVLDIICEWQEPLDFDPSCLPAWAEWIAMNESGEWFWFQKEPVVTIDEEEQGIWLPIMAGMKGGIHYEYAPRGYTGHWNDSLYKVSELKNQES